MISVAYIFEHASKIVCSDNNYLFLQLRQMLKKRYTCTSIYQPMKLLQFFKKLLIVIFC